MYRIGCNKHLVDELILNDVIPFPIPNILEIYFYIVVGKMFFFLIVLQSVANLKVNVWGVVFLWKKIIWISLRHGVNKPTLWFKVFRIRSLRKEVEDERFEQAVII